MPCGRFPSSLNPRCVPGLCSAGWWPIQAICSSAEAIVKDAIEACKVLSEHLKSGRDVAGLRGDDRSDGEAVAGVPAEACCSRRLIATSPCNHWLAYDNDGERTTIATRRKNFHGRGLMAVLSCTSLTISLTALPRWSVLGRAQELAVAIRQSIARQLGLSEDLPDEVGSAFSRMSAKQKQRVSGNHLPILRAELCPAHASARCAS